MSSKKESASFAMQLAQLLGKAGYDAPTSISASPDMLAVLPIGGVAVGVAIIVKDQNDEAAVAIQRGLQTIGIDAPGRVAEQQQERIIILVGAKPSA